MSLLRILNPARRFTQALILSKSDLSHLQRTGSNSSYCSPERTLWAQYNRRVITDNKNRTQATAKHTTAHVRLCAGRFHMKHILRICTFCIQVNFVSCFITGKGDTILSFLSDTLQNYHSKVMTSRKHVHYHLASPEQ